MTDDTRFARLPRPPYYVVAFSSTRRDGDHGYGAMADTMVELALRQPGCLGVESAREADGFGITNSYWADEASLIAWRNEAKHTLARKLGNERWYEHYELRVARVERAYAMGDGNFGHDTTAKD